MFKSVIISAIYTLILLDYCLNLFFFHDFIKEVERKSSATDWVCVLPDFLFKYGYFFTVPYFLGILPPHPEFSVFFQGLLLRMSIGAFTGYMMWIWLGISAVVESAIKYVGIDRERKREIELLKERCEDDGLDFDPSKINNDCRYEYLSYDGLLVKLFKGPNLKGELIIPEGIEAIDCFAFDRFVKRKVDPWYPRLCFKDNVKTLVLPTTIKEFNVDNFWENITLDLKDSRIKMYFYYVSRCSSSPEYTKNFGAFFTGLLQVLPAEWISDEYNRWFVTLSKDEETRLVSALSEIKDPLIKVYLMDILYEHMLCGVLSPQYFTIILNKASIEYKERYKGRDTEPLYGTEKDAVEKYALKYYEAENIRREQSTRRWRRKHPDKVPMTKAVLRNFLQSVEEASLDPDAFREQHSKELVKIAQDLDGNRTEP